MISVVVESWNVDGRIDSLSHLMGALSYQVVAAGAEVVVTHCGIPEAERSTLAIVLARAIKWIELPATAGYYEHKNRGFEAATGDVVVFIDGDCDPARGWLAAITAPFAGGARVVAGATSLPGALGKLANQIDFPYFDARGRRRSIEDAPATVRNFFANNVAFARDAFAGYPTIEPMFHGQCQVLALRLVAAGVPIRFAPGARVTHAWPDGLRDFLAVRLLRGADTVSLLPYVLGAYAPRARSVVARLGALPTLALLGARAASATWSALRSGPRVRGLGFVAATTVIDALGAAAAPAVYRFVA